MAILTGIPGRNRLAKIDMLPHGRQHRAIHRRRAVSTEHGMQHGRRRWAHLIAGTASPANCRIHVLDLETTRRHGRQPILRNTGGPGNPENPLPRPGVLPFPSWSGMGSMNGLATDRFAAAGSAAADFPGMRRAAAMRREGIFRDGHPGHAGLARRPGRTMQDRGHGPPWPLRFSCLRRGVLKSFSCRPHEEVLPE